MKRDLSILIPSRNEMFLAKTVEDILAHIEGDTEIIVVLDGAWTNPGLPQHERVTVIYHPVAIGQRAATNEACKLSEAKYIMKVDAHCAFDQGFDVKMMADMHDDWTMVPRMYNLHAFDWVCKCGHRIYQGPTPEKCEKCGKKMAREMIWQPRLSRKSDFYRFDKTLHFQYWGALGHRPESAGDIAETMSLQGSCFMLTREKYWELNVCDEAHGSWGQQGVEVACKTWLSGGKVMVNKKTWYAHMFRTQGGDFGFPYPNPGVEQARSYSRDLWFNNKWAKAVHPLSWLIEKFNPPDWEISKGIVYYTDNRLDKKIMKVCQEQIKKSFKGSKIISVSLKPIHFGDNITLPLERGYLTMFKQILAGLEALDTDVVFFCEHDVLYSKEHFEFVPPKTDTYYYNEHTYKVDAKTGQVVFYYCKQLSGICAYRELLLQHYRERVRRVEENGFSRAMGFEPGSHNRTERVDDYKAERWMSKIPNVDIRHNKNLTQSRWSQEQFRDKRNCQGWKLTDEIPGWGKTKGRFDDFLKDLKLL